MRSVTFLDGPWRSRHSAVASDWPDRRAPPQRTRCSRVGISSFPKLCADLLKGHGRKAPDGLWRQAIAMIDVFTVPTSGERFDDPGRFATMLIERGVEDCTFAVVGEPLVRTDVRGEFATEIIVEGPLREPREELARKCAESIPASEATYCPLDFLGRRPKQRRQHRPDQRRQALDGSHLRHLAQVSSAAPGAGILINCGGEASKETHQTWRDPDSYAEPSQIVDEFRASCGERDLGEKPKGVKEGGISGCVL